MNNFKATVHPVSVFAIQLGRAQCIHSINLDLHKGSHCSIWSKGILFPRTLL